MTPFKFLILLCLLMCSLLGFVHSFLLPPLLNTMPDFTNETVAEEVANYACKKENCLPLIKACPYAFLCVKFCKQYTGDQFGLKAVKTQIGQELSTPPGRKNQIVANRLRIGHTAITHSFIFKNEPISLCEECNTALSVFHIILECPKYNRKRSLHHIPDSLETALGTQIEKTLDFLRSINIFNKI
ncbi:unnamed protein product [Brassicogethes aeneus]|uniref:Uncharacterized protein n=1 Tax=Brassicogethes aeneus TaxID=1431903 RepID=A0A9P0B4S9_BRAAE|nr:unnamed protein product [Brassicogethes aeneus]